MIQSFGGKIQTIGRVKLKRKIRLVPDSTPAIWQAQNLDNSAKLTRVKILCDFDPIWLTNQAPK
jgi:hypothetical protein